MTNDGIMSPAASSLLDALLLEPEEGALVWRRWRAEVDLEDLAGESLAVLPLLSGRLPAWLSEDARRDPDREKVLGICKRGWAQNQLRYRELTDAWTLLAQGGAGPIAVGGCAAWALLYLEEKAVRPIRSIDILIRRDRAILGKRLLEAGGWILEPAMPELAGRVWDEFAGLWFRSPSGTALFLAWRLRKVSPEMAEESETLPACRAFDLHGTAVSLLETEELLLDALTRDANTLVSWQCDAVLLLRNRSVDWPRFFLLSRDAPLAAERLAQLRDGGAVSIPAGPLPPTKSGLRRRFDRLYVDYRQVAWSKQEPHSLSGFGRYLLQRGLRQGFSGVASSDALTVIDASKSGGSTAAEYQRYRALFFFLTIRDIRLRYRKTWRGVLWALLQPLLPMLIFAAIFSRVIRPELRDGPYWLFVLAGLAPWNFFANAVNYSSVTFVNNFGLLNKVYFPRAILPAAAVTACLLDLLVSSCALTVLSWWKGYPPNFRVFLLPPLILAAAVVAVTIGLAAASLNVLYRDLRPLVPFLVQVGMYATPVLYPLAMIPSALRRLAWLNPMTGVVEAFRATLFHSSIDWSGEAISAVCFCAMACVSALLFRKVEADLAERI